MTPTDPLRDVLVTLPAGWRRHPSPSGGVLVAARSRLLPPSGFRPELVLRCEAVADDPAGWVRRVAHDRWARRADGRDLVVDRWAWVEAGVGLALSCVADRAEHGDLAPVFEAVAASVALVPALPRTA